MARRGMMIAERGDGNVAWEEGRHPLYYYGFSRPPVRCCALGAGRCALLCRKNKKKKSVPCSVQPVLTQCHIL